MQNSKVLIGEETWIDTDFQRHVSNKQWLQKDQNRPVIAKWMKSAGKSFALSIFFNASGSLFEIPVPNICTGNDNIYKEHVLSKAASL